MPRIMKKPDEAQDIRPYDFFAGFQIERTVSAEEPEEEEEEDGGAEEEAKEEQFATERANEIISEAEKKAEQILADARGQADILRQKAFRDGYEEGCQNGTRDAYEEQRKLLDQEIRQLQTNAADVIESVSIEKAKLLEQYVDDLKRISLAVAEKIIQTSLQSSGTL